MVISCPFQKIASLINERLGPKVKSMMESSEGCMAYFILSISSSPECGAKSEAGVMQCPIRRSSRWEPPSSGLNVEHHTHLGSLSAGPALSNKTQKCDQPLLNTTWPQCDFGLIGQLTFKPQSARHTLASATFRESTGPETGVMLRTGLVPV